MRRTTFYRAARAAALSAAISPAAAQSFNVDLGPPDSGPPITYRGAGLPGHWHSFEATTWGLFYTLLDVHGNATDVRVRQIGGTEIVQATLGGPGQPQGGDAILLGDALVTHDLENCLFFENLEAGTYEVISYAWMPTVPATMSHVWIDDHPDEPLIGGAWPGALAQGTIYARHEFVVTSGIINMHSGIPDGGSAEPGAALNGIQIRRMGPEPPLFVEPARLEWLRALGAARYDVARGDLGTLRATGGDFTAASEACLANNTAGTSLAPAGEPDPGEGQWFLVRGTGAGGNLTWNSPGTGQVGDRDAEIAACS